ncbi:hypothetical protein CEG14_17350 [Bordetella genomosp. 1]|uniref:DUF4142 domain-containing protein n=1 Tax=Bordetella genomosp. 1 TaxID=1395607 RepID=A0A261S5M4_9BORD|nr:DUF4142 domain-containing protein [Bordetella genomosp. 1]OZI32674.1 hypothetical protein CEG14_17350 [Bordetella genomosp. 1]OZI65971.1 hypothetical protein CAL27_13375 [Bordetella genomosp. 1]
MNRFGRHWRALTLAGVLAGAVGALSTTMVAPAAAADALDAADRDFIERAAQGARAELAGSQLASERAQSAAVKAYAEQTRQTLTQALDGLDALGKRKGVTVPDAPSFSGNGKLAALAEQEGVEFDRAYALRFGVVAHQDALTLFARTALQGKDAEVRAYAQERMPALEAQLKAAQALQDQVDLGK